MFLVLVTLKTASLQRLTVCVVQQQIPSVSLHAVDDHSQDGKFATSFSTIHPFAAKYKGTDANRLNHNSSLTSTKFNMFNFDIAQRAWTELNGAWQYLILETCFQNVDKGGGFGRSAAHEDTRKIFCPFTSICLGMFSAKHISFLFGEALHAKCRESRRQSSLLHFVNLDQSTRKSEMICSTKVKLNCFSSRISIISYLVQVPSGSVRQCSNKNSAFRRDRRAASGLAKPRMDAAGVPDEENCGSCADHTTGTRPRTDRESDCGCSGASGQAWDRQVMDFLVPLVTEEIAKDLQPVRPEHIHERVAEPIFTDVVPHFKKVVVDVLQCLFQEHFQKLLVEQLVPFFF